MLNLRCCEGGQMGASDAAARTAFTAPPPAGSIRQRGQDMSNKALDQKLLEELIIGALNREPEVRPAEDAAAATSPGWTVDARLQRRVLIVGDHEHVAEKLGEALG